MQLEINQLKVGVTVFIDNEVFVIVGVDHVKPGKGSAFARTKLKNLRRGTVIERTYKSAERIEDAYVEQKELHYSYRDGDFFHFLDQTTFEDIPVHIEDLSEVKDFLKDNICITASFHNNQLLNISLPTSVVYKVTHTEPGIKGDTAKGATKPATIESGAVIQVPLFIHEGDNIVVDTRTHEYTGRG